MWWVEFRHSEQREKDVFGPNSTHYVLVGLSQPKRGRLHIQLPEATNRTVLPLSGREQDDAQGEAVICQLLHGVDYVSESNDRREAPRAHGDFVRGPAKQVNPSSHVGGTVDPQNRLFGFPGGQTYCVPRCVHPAALLPCANSPGHLAGDRSIDCQFT